MSGGLVCVLVLRVVSVGFVVGPGPFLLFSERPGACPHWVVGVFVDRSIAMPPWQDGGP